MDRFATYRFQLTYRLPEAPPDPATLAKSLEASGARFIDNCPVPPDHVVIEFRRTSNDPSLALMEALRIVRKQVSGAELIACSPLLPDQ